MLLSLRNVTKRYPRGRRGAERVALRDVSLDLSQGDCVAVWGPRRSGRTTLLEVCAGIEAPTEGEILLDGRSVSAASALGLPGGIGYAHRQFSRMYGVVVEQVSMPLLRRAVSPAAAQASAAAALERVGAADCAELMPDELEPAELERVTIARAIVAQPRVLLIDAPTSGLRASERDRLVELLGSLARRDLTAVLMTIDELPGFGCVDRVLSIHDGELRGDAVREPARVVPLRSGRVEPAS